MSENINYRKIAEMLYIEKMITEIYPTGIISLVSDTFDLWEVVTYALPKLKDKILARAKNDGVNKVVIRPDSGNPADILCGTCTKHGEGYYPEEKGLIELLDEIFGSTVNSKGFRELNPAIGAIYGDSITLDLCEEIIERLAAKGYASTNVVFGIGSYTYQHLTRDSLGFAMKATSVVINGERKAIFKDPKTDNGVKKSAKGLVKVVKDLTGKYELMDETHPLYNNEKSTELNDLKIQTYVSLAEIRNRLKG